jgi:N-acetyl-gamma-glutamylphosphate reductase
MNRSERATQIWAVLAWAASHRQTITYSQLAQVTGAFTAGLGKLLEPIQSYCQLNNLPPLTILVVQQESGLPGSGFTAASASDLASVQAKVFGFDWLEHRNPGAAKLEEAVQQLPSNNP